jgi:hypothetical protein
MTYKLIHVILICAIVFSVSCSNKNPAIEKEIPSSLVNNPLSGSGKSNKEILPKFQFVETNHDFGVIIQGEKVSFTYRFKNVGNSALIISSATASCGCTVANYDKNPVGPGKDGKVEIIFDSNSKVGSQHKTVNILANTQPNLVTLNFTAEVVVPK